MKIFKHALAAPYILFLTNAASTGMQLLASVLLARALGPEGRGLLATLTVYPLALAAVAPFGLHLSGARMAARAPEMAQSVYLSVMRAVSIPTTVTLALLALIVVKTVPVQPGLVFLLGGVIVLTGLVNTIQIQIEMSRGHIRNAVLTRITFSLGHLLLISALAVAGIKEPLVYFAVLALTNLIACSLTTIVVASQVEPTPVISSNPLSPLKLLRRAMPDGASVLVQALVVNADRMMVAMIMPPEATGYYVVALAAAQIQSLLSEAMAPLFFARVAAAHDELDAIWLVQRVRQGIIVNLIGLVLIVIAIPVVVPLLFGVQYGAAVPLALSLAIPCALNAARRPMAEILKARGEAVQQSKADVAAFIMFAICSLTIAQYKSVYVIAAAMLSGAAVGFIVTAYLTRAAIEVPLRSLLVPTPNDLRAVAARLWRLR